MAKKRWPKSLKSLVESHITPENSQELEKHKTDIENNVTRILDHIKQENEEVQNSINRSEVVNLIEELYKEYQSLHGHYENLTGEIRKIAHDNEKTESCSSSSSGSDSESDHSSKEKTKKNGKSNNKTPNETESLKQELKNLEKDLVTTREEKEALSLEYFKVMSKIKQAEELIESLKKSEAEFGRITKDINGQKEALSTVDDDLRANVNQLKEENSKLSSQNGNLKRQMELAMDGALDLNQQLERANQQVESINQELVAAKEENKALSLRNTVLVFEKEVAEETVQVVRDEAKQLEERLERENTAHTVKVGTYDEYMVNASAEISDLKKRATAMTTALETASTQKVQLLEQIQSIADDAKHLRRENTELQSLQTELQNQILDLEKKSEKREDEVSAVLKKLGDSESKASMEVKGLLSQVDGLKLELNVAKSQNDQLEMQTKRRTQEASDYKNQLETVNAKLFENKQEMEATQEELEQIKAKIQLIENTNREAAEEMENREAAEEMERLLQTKDSEIDALKIRQVELLEGLTAASYLEQELYSIKYQKEQLELQVEKRTKEVSEYVSQLEVQNSELSSMILEEQWLLHEHRDLAMQVNGLRQEAESLKTQRSEAEEQVTISIQKAENVRNENSELILLKNNLQDQISVLEGVLKEKENVLSGVQEKLHDSTDQSSTEASSLQNQLNELQHELEVSKQEIEARKEEVEELQAKLLLLENEKTETAELTERSLHTKDAEIEEMKSQKDQLELRVETLQKKQDELLGEIGLLREYKSNTEVKLSLLNRRLTVTEQSLNEKEECYQKVEKNFHEERNLLQGKIRKLTSRIASAKSELTEIKDSLEKTIDAYSELEMAVKNSLDDHGSFETRISHSSEVLQTAKNWVSSTNHEKQELQELVKSLIDELNGIKAHELQLREKVSMLEAAVGEEHREKEILMERGGDLGNEVAHIRKRMKEMEDLIAERDEQKREAIRQLCMWIDVQNNAYNELKEKLKTICKGNRRAN